mgnify:FL=1
MRGLSVGSDTQNYFFWYEGMKTTPWSDVLTQFASRYSDNKGTGDIGYDIFTKLTQVVVIDFQFFLFISALFFFVPLGMLLNRYAKDTLQLMFAFILYVSLFNVICLSGQRQEIALGMSILAFQFYVDKKYIKAAIAIGFGMTIHMSILLFLLIPLLGLLRPNSLRYIHALSFLLIPIVLTSSSSLLILMADAVDNAKYREYGEQAAQGGATTFTFLMELLSLFCLYVFQKTNLNKDVVLKKLYIMLPLFTFFAPLIMHHGSMVRISQFFHIYLLVLLPYAFDKFSGEKERTFIYASISIVLMILAMSTSDTKYLFFWQDPYSALYLN